MGASPLFLGVVAEAPTFVVLGAWSAAIDFASWLLWSEKKSTGKSFYHPPSDSELDVDEHGSVLGLSSRNDS